MVNTFLYIPHLIAIILLIPVITNFLRAKGQKYVSIFSTVFLIATALSAVTLYYKEIGAELMYAVGEFFISILDLIAILVLLINLHSLLYVRRLEVTSLLPIPMLALTSLGERGFSIKAEVLEHTLEALSLVILGAAMVLAITTVYFGYQMYRERRGGSTYWLLLSFTIFLIFLAQVSFFLFEVLEEIFTTGPLGESIKLLSLTARGVLSLLAAVFLNISWWYYERKVLPLLKAIE